MTSFQFITIYLKWLGEERDFYVPLALRGAWLCVRLAPHTPERFYIRSIHIERFSSYPISGHCYFYPLFIISGVCTFLLELAFGCPSLNGPQKERFNSQTINLWFVNILIRDFIELVSIFLGSKSLGTQLRKHSCRLHDQFQDWFTLSFRVLSLLLPFVGSLQGFLKVPFFVSWFSALSHTPIEVPALWGWTYCC